MGLLDDAIREHLDLKRRRGGDPEEIERMERDALGPVRREPRAMPPSDDDLVASAQAFDDDYGDYDEHQTTVMDAAAAAGPSGPAASPEADDDGVPYDDSDFFGNQPTRTQDSSGREEKHPTGRFRLFGRRHTEEHEVVEPDERRHAPESYFGDDTDDPFARDEDDPFTQDEQADYGDDPFAEAERGREDDEPPRGQASAGDEPERQAPPSLSFEREDVPPPPKRPRFPDLPSQAAPDSDPDDEADFDDPGMHSASTAETGPRDEPYWDDKTQLFEFDDEPAEPETAEDEDVLEGTPDFLQDTPDHDRLWFEQKPPSDFDFGK